MNPRNVTRIREGGGGVIAFGNIQFTSLHRLFVMKLTTRIA